MGDRPTPPKVYANHVLKIMIQSSCGSDIIIEPTDYQYIRDLYRSCGGLWEQYFHGNPQHTRLLGTIVKEWGKLPERKRSGQTTV